MVSQEERWEKHFSALVEFKRTYEHCNVPFNWPENPGLGHWVNKQRYYNKKGQLGENRSRRLEAIEFQWHLKDRSKWEDMLSALVEFKNTYGHSEVPICFQENHKLPVWISNQRRRRLKEGPLSEVRTRLLEGIGFQWQLPVKFRWENMFSGLVEFKKVHGHCNVPFNWPKNPRLALWVSTQRHLKKAHKLNQERIRKLEDLGFIWDPLHASWEEMFSVLVRFRETHGHCDVPQGWSENPKLGKWVSTQRSVKKKGNLSEDRIRRLEGIGFQWKVPTRARK